MAYFFEILKDLTNSNVVLEIEVPKIPSYF